jgi:hypothetical protein
MMRTITKMVSLKPDPVRSSRRGRLTRGFLQRGQHPQPRARLLIHLRSCEVRSDQLRAESLAAMIHAAPRGNWSAASKHTTKLPLVND